MPRVRVGILGNASLRLIKVDTSAIDVRADFLHAAAAALAPDSSDLKRTRTFLAGGLELTDHSMLETDDTVYVAFKGEAWRPPEEAQKLRTAAERMEDANLRQCGANARKALANFMRMSPMTRQPVCAYTLCGPPLMLCHPLSREYIWLGGPLGVKCLLVGASLDSDLSGHISVEERATFDAEVKELVSGLTRVMRTMLIVLAFAGSTAHSALVGAGSVSVSVESLDWFGVDDKESLGIFWLNTVLANVVAGVGFGLQVVMLVVVATLDGGLLHAGTVGDFYFLFRFRRWLWMLVWLPILCFGLSAILIAGQAFFASPRHGLITLGGAVFLYFTFAMSASYVLCHETLLSQHRQAVKTCETLALQAGDPAPHQGRVHPAPA